MRRLWTGLAVMAAMGWCTLTAMAQNSPELYPIDRTVVQTTTAYAPPGGWNFPGSNASFAASTTWEPVQPVAYTPVAARYPAQAFVKYTPVVARYPAQPYTAYAPVANDYLAAAAAAHPGKTVWVHPKVYVEGQPIRNLLRAITP